MISSETHTRKWLEKSMSLFKGKDPILIERVIKALTLLEQLKLQGVDFIFKGGSALLLLLKEINRFSIDIDIVLPKKVESLADIFREIIKEGVFTGFAEDKRVTTGVVPKAHFKFFYNSVLNITKENAVVLLDVLFEENPYTQIVSLPIESPFIKTEHPLINVALPDINCILGDKLTAFAPNTTGIPYGKRKSLEMIKQLYDIGKLFDKFNNIHIVKKTFNHIAAKELEYRNFKKNEISQVFDDIFEAAVIISFRGTYQKDHFDELKEGIKKIIHYIYSGEYHIEDAVASAAKAAYLSRLLKISALEKINRFDRQDDLSQLLITHPNFTKFNKIKKYKPEAFFYWHHAIKLLVK